MGVVCKEICSVWDCSKGVGWTRETDILAIGEAKDRINRPAKLEGISCQQALAVCLAQVFVDSETPGNTHLLFATDILALGADPGSSRVLGINPSFVGAPLGANETSLVCENPFMGTKCGLV